MNDALIREAIWNFYLPIEMPGIWYFDHVRTLKRIELYYHGKYETGEFDTQGFRKQFYNISKPACDAASKFLGLQTKNLMLIPDYVDEDVRVWLMQKDLREWLRETDFASVLAAVKKNIVKYGSVVLKKDNTGNFSETRLLNLRFDIAANSLEESGFVAELNMMSERDIRKMKNWNSEAIDELVSRGKKTPLTRYAVYEIYKQNSGAKGKKWHRQFKADIFAYYNNPSSLLRTAEVRINRVSDYLPSVLLYEDEVDELPYREHHFDRVPGRWLGLGYVEYLFDNQIRRNEISNIRGKGLYFTSLKLYQTQDQTAGNNILTDTVNGDILKTLSPINPVTIEERNLAYFNDETSDWDRNKSEKTFATDLSKGENLPSHTPLGVANLQLGMVTSFFDEKRAEFGNFLRKLILKDVIPSFKENVAKKHDLMFGGMGAESDKLREAIVQMINNKQSFASATATGFAPSTEEQNAFSEKTRSELKKRKFLHIKIPDSFYEDARYKFDVLTTGEQIDTASVRTTLMTVLQILGTNPAVLQDEKMRTILFMMMELSGVNPVDLDLLREQASAPTVPGGNQPQQANNPGAVPQLPRGGSVSLAPKGIANPELVPRRQIL